MNDNIIGTVMISAGNDCHPPQIVYVEGKSAVLTGGYVLNVLNENRKAVAHRNELTGLDLHGFEIDKERWNIAQSEKRLNLHQMRLKALTATPTTEEKK